MRIFFRSTALLTIVLLFGCQTMEHKQAEVKVAREIPTGVTAKPLQFKKVVVKLPRGTVIGQTRVGMLCLPGREITWTGGRAELSDEFTDAFRQELEKVNYKLVGNPDALFDDAADWKAEFLIAGLIKEIQANICYPQAGFFNTNAARGGAYVKVDWQIYSRLDRKVVFETTTEGSSTRGDSNSGAVVFYVDAFAAATQNLLADENFYRLVTTGSTKQVAVTDQPKKVSALALKNTKPFSNELQNHINEVRAAVVTVFAGDGHGSGFFVSSDGYLLTNEHVVRGAKFVKIKLATGREILGEVVRTNTRRDVALIKVEEGNMVPLPIRKGEANIGGEVFALGSPLDQRYNTTISKGIVSGYRTEDNISYIQSDVNVLPGNSGGPLIDSKGNAIGITASGLSVRGMPVGLNFFIPIESAFKELDVVFK